MKLAFIPIDNRPVCYNLPKEIAAIDDKLKLFLPERRLLGGLKSTADMEEILKWLESINEMDAIVVSLDTIAYGGLISSRRSKDSFEKIKERLEKLKKLFEGKTKIYAFSSIMRISNNNINEEEKDYWNEYGEKIFEYSYNFHKEGIDESEVPQEILHDYLATRRRNFEINKIYLDWLEEKFFETLVFSKDDCAQFGFNVLEAQILQRLMKERDLTGFVKTGADEIPLTLFARAVCDYNNKVPKISAKFLAPQDKYLISNYEDISIENCVQDQIELAGCQYTEENNEDIILLVNNFEEQQGEIVMGVKTKGFSGKLILPKTPFIIADVKYANGADNDFIKQLFISKLGLNFYGYSAWNTSANTLGSLICAFVIRFFAKEYNEESFKKLQMIRFLDDWAYQANVRQILKEKGKREKGKENRPDFRRRVGSLPHQPRPDFRMLKKVMTPYEGKLKKILKIKPEISYKFPWKRFFEIEVIIK